jgi:hypothetical protein
LTTPRTGVAGLDSEVSKDGGAFVDCTNEATEIGATGIYTLTLTQAEMTADRVVVRVQTTSYGTIVIVIDTLDLGSGSVLPIPGDLIVIAGQ